MGIHKLDKMSKKVRLVEGDFEGWYHLITKVADITFVSKEAYPIKQVEEKGFIIEHIQDR